jgi:hypothetical protein
MKMARGGMRTPRNPAPVSGPGRLSRRTDGGPQQTTQPMTGMAYGENVEFNEMQASAPLAATPPAAGRAAPMGAAGGSGFRSEPLFAPTAFPEEPVTAGANFGPGDGPPMIPQQSRPTQSLVNTFRKIESYTSDPKIARLISILEARGL